MSKVTTYRLTDLAHPEERPDRGEYGVVPAVAGEHVPERRLERVARVLPHRERRRPVQRPQLPPDALPRHVVLHLRPGHEGLQLKVN